MIQEFLNAIQERVGGFFADWFDFLTSPLWLWWGVGAGVAVLLVVLALLLPFKWFRAGLGAVFLLGGAFLAGGTQMYRRMRRETQIEREKRKALEKQLREQRRQSGSGWFWP